MSQNTGEQIHRMRSNIPTGYLSGHTKARDEVVIMGRTECTMLEASLPPNSFPKQIVGRAFYIDRFVSMHLTMLVMGRFLLLPPRRYLDT